MSDTPRTDDKAARLSGNLSCDIASAWDIFQDMADYARQLERELNEANKRIANLERLNDNQRVQLEQLTQWRTCAEELAKASSQVFEGDCIDYQEFTGLISGYSFMKNSAVEKNLQYALTHFNQLKEKESKG